MISNLVHALLVRSVTFSSEQPECEITESSWTKILICKKNAIGPLFQRGLAQKLHFRLLRLNSPNSSGKLRSCWRSGSTFTHLRKLESSKQKEENNFSRCEILLKQALPTCKFCPYCLPIMSSVFLGFLIFFQIVSNQWNRKLL